MRIAPPRQRSNPLGKSTENLWHKMQLKHLNLKFYFRGQREYHAVCVESPTDASELNQLIRMTSIECSHFRNEFQWTQQHSPHFSRRCRNMISVWRSVIVVSASNEMMHYIDIGDHWLDEIEQMMNTHLVSSLIFSELNCDGSTWIVNLVDSKYWFCIPNGFISFRIFLFI